MLSGRLSHLEAAKVTLTALAIAGCLYLLWLNLSLYPHNGDHYFFPRVAQNLVEHGGTFAHWALMSAPRYVPDLAIDIVSFSVAGSGIAGLALASVLLVALQGFAVSLVSWRCGADLGTALLAGLIYCAGCAIAGPHYTSFSYITWHVGTFAIILICLGLSLRRDESNGLIAAAILLLLTILVTASNPLAIPLLVVGMGFLSLLRLLQDYRRRNYLQRFDGWWWTILMPAGLTLAGCLMGMLMYRYLLPYPFDNPVDSSGLSIGRILHPDLALRAFADTVIALSTETVFMVALVLAILALAVFRHGSAFPFLCMVVGFWLVTSIANQGMIELGANNEPRYRIMAINGSIAITGISIALLSARWRVRFLVPLTALGLMIWTHSDVQSLYKQRYRDLKVEAECLSGHVEAIAAATATTASQLVGVSDLATTKAFPYLSDGRLRLIATKGRSKSVLHLMQDVSLLNRTPTYAVANIVHDDQDYTTRRMAYKLSRVKAVEQYGEPVSVRACSHRSILHYPDGLKLSPPRHWQLPPA